MINQSGRVAEEIADRRRFRLYFLDIHDRERCTSISGSPSMPPPPTPQVAASPALPVLKPRARQSPALLPRCVVGALLFLRLLMPVGAALDVEVQIHSVEAEQLANVRSFLSIEQQRTDPSLDEGRLRRYHQKAPGEVADALKGFGYYQVTTQSSLTQQDG